MSKSKFPSGYIRSLWTPDVQSRMTLFSSVPDRRHAYHHRIKAAIRGEHVALHNTVVGENNGLLWRFLAVTDGTVIWERSDRPEVDLHPLAVEIQFRQVILFLPPDHTELWVRACLNRRHMHEHGLVKLIMTFLQSDPYFVNVAD
jgi:hypothetical protein